MQASSLDNPAEHTFPRHDAVAGGLTDRAGVVALLSDLGNLQQDCPAQLAANTHLQASEVDILDDDVFSESTELDVRQNSPDAFDAFDR